MYKRIFSRLSWGACVALTVLAVWPAAGLARAAEVDLARLDLTRNRLVDDADARMVLDALFKLQRDGLCARPALASRDVNGDGCVTIADAQAILARWGTTTDPAVGQAVTDGVLAPEATFTVNSSGWEADTSPGDGRCLTAGGTCTLRAAIEEANARAGSDRINFDVLNADGSCPSLVTIKPPAGDTTQLAIDAADDAGVTINGYSQCSAAKNSGAVTGNAVIKVELMGNQAADIYGLSIYSPDNVVKGLSVYNWERQIFISGSGASENTIEGNFIGPNAAQNSAPFGSGVVLWFGANNNTVGGTALEDRNIISGNAEDAVDIFGDGVVENQVIGNYIGTKQDGLTPFANTADGVDLAEGAADNWVGGDSDSERNVIAGNNRDGVEISHLSSVTGNHVTGNYIGVGADGTTPVGNGQNGVTLEDAVTLNYVYDNVIANNGWNGVRIYAICDDNEIYDNLIGVAPDGETPMPNGTDAATLNGRSGVYILGGSQGNLIEANIIAHHPEYGIRVTTEAGYLGYSRQTFYNTFSQNTIFGNGLGLGITNGGIRLSLAEDGMLPNLGLGAPAISRATTKSVKGTACANCTVEIFIAESESVDSAGEGQIYVAQGEADSNGNFDIDVDDVDAGQEVTATATDSQGNTSEFAVNWVVFDDDDLVIIWLPFLRR